MSGINLTSEEYVNNKLEAKQDKLELYEEGAGADDTLFVNIGGNGMRFHHIL